MLNGWTACRASHRMSLSGAARAGVRGARASAGALRRGSARGRGREGRREAARQKSQAPRGRGGAALAGHRPGGWGASCLVRVALVIQEAPRPAEQHRVGTRVVLRAAAVEDLLVLVGCVRHLLVENSAVAADLRHVQRPEVRVVRVVHQRVIGAEVVTVGGVWGQRAAYALPKEPAWHHLHRLRCHGAPPAHDRGLAFFYAHRDFWRSANERLSFCGCETSSRDQVTIAKHGIA